MQTLSLILSIMAIVFSALSSLTKGEKNIVRILVFMSISNFSVALSYLVLGMENINGAMSCFIGGISCAINFLYTSKQKDVPLWLSGIYALAYTALNIISSSGINLGCIIAIVACLCFVMSVVQKNGRMFRVWMLSNNILWCTYDIVQGAYQPLLTHSILFAFYVIGIIINDRKTKSKSNL